MFKIDEVALIAQIDGKCYQLAFTKEMINKIINELPKYFEDGVIKALPEEINIYFA